MIEEEKNEDGIFAFLFDSVPKGRRVSLGKGVKKRGEGNGGGVYGAMSYRG